MSLGKHFGVLPNTFGGSETMGRKRAAAKKSDFEEKLFWYLVAAYIGHATGQLDQEKEQKLDLLSQESGVSVNWKDSIKEDLGVDAAFIRSLYSLCTEYKSREQALVFMMRGFGCPEPVERLRELFG